LAAINIPPTRTNGRQYSAGKQITRSKYQSSKKKNQKCYYGNKGVNIQIGP
jgi:hypothetical protein